MDSNPSHVPTLDLVARPAVSEKLVLLILIIVQFTSIVDFMVIMPLEPQLSAALDLDTQHFGMIVSAYTFAAGLIGFLASPILDRFARRSAFLLLYSGFLLGTVACGAAWNYPVLLAARLFTGAFGGLLGGTALAIVGDVFPEHRRGAATGALMTAFAMASVLGVPIGLHLGQIYGWNTPFYIIAGLGLPILFLAAYVLPRLDSHLRHKRAFDLRRHFDTFREPNDLLAYSLTTAMQFGSFAVVTFLSAYFVHNVGIDEHDLPYAYIVGGVFALVGSPLVGKISDRVGKPPVYRVMAVAAACVILIVTHLPPVPLAVAVSVMGLLILCNAGRMVPAMAMLTSSVPPARRGGFLSMNSAVQHVACGFGAFVGGQMLSKNDAGELVGYGHVGIMGAVVTIGSIFLANRLKMYSPPQPMPLEASIAAAAVGSCDAEDALATAESL